MAFLVWSLIHSTENRANRLDNARLRNGGFLPAGQSLDLPLSFRQFVRPGDQRHPEAFLLRIGQLLAYLLGVGKYLRADPRRTQRPGDALIVANAIRDKLHHEDRSGGG